MNLTRSFFIEKIIWVILLFNFAQSTAIAQTISPTLPVSFSTCTPAQFGVTITNTTGNLMENINVTIIFPCGIEYAGTLTGAAEDDVSNLSQPIFSLSNIAAGAAATFTFEALAPCNTQTCTDAQILQNTIDLTSSAGSTSITTDPYIVEHPYLIIESVLPPVLSGQQGDIITRTITVRNTRLGSLTNFNLTDSYDGGIVISTALGNGWIRSFQLT